MATPISIRTFDELVTALRGAGVPFDVDAEAQRLDIQTGATELAGRMRVRWDKLLPFVQVIQPMLLDVPEARVPALEAALTRLNNIAAVAGLEYDYPSRMLYYRITAPILVDGVRLDLLNAYMHGAISNARQFLPMLRKVIDGLPGEAVLEHTSETPAN